MGRNLRTAIWSRGLALVLLCVLIVPQMVPAMPTDTADHHVSTPIDAHHGAEHPRPSTAEGEMGEHCHPGIDCHLQAVIEINGIPVPLARLDGDPFLPHGLFEPGIEHSFDPPPPRVRS